jgi:tetratricopeptide (TPR) repeat protein
LIRYAAFAIAFALFILSNSSGWAQDDEENKPQTNYTTRPEVYELIARSQKHLEEKKYKESLSTLERAQRRFRLNAYEKALVFQLMGYVYVSQENFKKTIGVWEQAVAEKALPKSTELNLMYQLGQLYAAIENYNKSVELFERWLAAAKKPTPDSLYKVALANFQAKRYKSAINYCERAVRGTKRVKDSWRQLLRAAYVETKDFRNAVRVQKQFVERHPLKKSEWLQLSSMYSQLKDDRRAVAVLELAYKNGLLDKQNEYMNLAQNYMFLNVPYKAAEVMEDGIKRKIIKTDSKILKQLANAWQYARETDKALSPLGKAANLSAEGELYIQIAQIHLEKEQWNKAIDNLRKGLKKKLKRPGKAEIMLGISHFNKKELTAAEKAFRRASTYESSRREAERWLGFVESERQAKAH